MALELCRRMLEATRFSGQAAGDVIIIAAADVLAHRWGATERLLRANFEAAAATRVTLPPTFIRLDPESSRGVWPLGPMER